MHICVCGFGMVLGCMCSLDSGTWMSESAFAESLKRIPQVKTPLHSSFSGVESYAMSAICIILDKASKTLQKDVFGVYVCNPDYTLSRST